MTRVVAFVDDLMDRSKLAAAVPQCTFVREADECAGADVVVVDLARHADVVLPRSQFFRSPTAAVTGEI